jgi:hypothetical protein
MEYMRAGDFDTAWRISDDVLRRRAATPCAHLPRHQQWIWNGEPVDGKRVLVRCYHGLGDTIQFSRYLPMLRERAREVTIWAQERLLPLLPHVRGIDRALPLHDGVPDCEYDVDVEIMELPHLFRSTLRTLPARVPYIDVDRAALPPTNARRVGIVWKSGDWGHERNVPVEFLRPLAHMRNVELHVLQHGVARRQWPYARSIMHPESDALADARIMGALDVVISVDTFAAHLAGAIGARVWVLLPRDCDWRWMKDRDDSPWYPTMRLFRQERPGDWEPVIARVARALVSLRT